MKTIYSPKHHGHSGQMEVTSDGLVPGFEKPSRAEYIKARVEAVKLGPILPPQEHDIAIAKRVHAAPFIDFLNDFEALGYSLIAPERLETQAVLASAVPAPPKATRMVLGAGTGFNAAACYWPAFGAAPHVAAAECGHTTLAIEGDEERDLQAALAAGRGRASVERALSGNGLREIYGWICARDGRPGNAATSAEITQAATAGTDEQAVAAAHLFLRLLGRVVGDLALTFLPYGGIYLYGGVCRALAPLVVATDTFRDAFRAKGRMGPFMADFEAHLLVDDRVALAGCVEWLGIATASRGNAPVLRRA